ncbi:LCP family protein required for cell wall assembly [Spinactinospora alkalitolerans]|uniref:LCP family protein required for cell wall assembly n=1 Tax=Spinactinospora alkalitolerans TaxID=687207 RepID=A0A852U447_9ACTN|nr:LCP family protein [Spinactinospora alkalitolerans]NYE49683.1 LCP family protein required for cell wall assembly [Spinactinospora alkalitolerans]
MPRNRSSSRRAAPARSARKKLTAGGWVAVIATALVICSSLTAYGAYYDIYGNISQESIDTDAFGDRPSKVEGAVNILVVGSDSRAGENAEYGEAESERPDTLVIAHISPDQDGATLINLPRDSLVDMPSCSPTEDKPGMSAHSGMIGESMSLGGVQCLWKTVEQLTDIHIDHFVSVDFGGFKGMVDSLGGVEMCIPEPLEDKKAKLDLEAGEQTLDGEQSLAFVRSRYAQGDGSDLGRIERQQEFMGAMLRKVMSSEVLASPTNLYDFLGSVTDSITTDDEFTVDSMADIAIAMREVDMSKVQFITVPNGAAPQDPNRIAWTQPDASELFQAVANDVDLSDDEEEQEGGGSEEEAEEPSVAPEEVAVEVINGTTVSGLAGEAGAGLGDKGFQVTGTGNPQGAVPEATTVYYGSGQKEHAEAVAAELVNATTEENPALGTTVQLVLSGDWDGLKGAGGGGIPDSVEGTTAEAAETNACE